MRVLLSPSLFPDARRSSLGVLCEHGLELRHRLQVTDSDHPDFQNWLNSVDEMTRFEWQEALDYGDRDNGLEPSSVEIKIVGGSTSDWAPPCPELSMEDGLALLDEKFKIVLEGDAEDRKFLECMSTPEQYTMLRDFETKRRCLEFVLGGGIDSMIKRAQGDARMPGAPFRRWYLFDSDGLRPGEASDKSDKLYQSCKDANLPCHRLKRRMIENYIPLNSFRTWVYQLPPRKQKERKRLFEAFKNLGNFKNTSISRRFHFNIKTGFKKGRDASALDEIFGDLTEVEKAALHNGFGEKIAELFQSRLRRVDFKDDGWDEINPEISQLLALIR